MSQPEATQTELRYLTEIPKAVEVDPATVKRCESKNQAMAMCFNLSGITLDTLAERLGVNKGTLSKVVRGRAPLPVRIGLIDYMRACGNLLPLQWLAWKSGYQLVDRAILESLHQPTITPAVGRAIRAGRPQKYATEAERKAARKRSYVKQKLKIRIAVAYGRIGRTRALVQRLEAELAGMEGK